MREAAQKFTPKSFNIYDHIRTVPNYPKPGVMFRDVTTLWQDAQGFRRTVDEMVQPFAGIRIDKVVGIEARGFVIGGAVAHQLSVGFVPLRKKGKLPYHTEAQIYDLEYGTDTLEIHQDAIRPGERVLIVDDLIATGGTVEAAVKLIRKMNGEAIGASFIINLPDLGGAEKVEKLGVPVIFLAEFEGE